MLNYIMADLSRISHKKSLIYTISGYIGLFLLMMFIVYNPSFTEVDYISKTNMFTGFYPLVVGIPIFLSIYYDDFKSKAMQVAIGYGISRSKVITIKFIESVILAFVSGLLLGLVVLVLPMFFKMSFTNAQLLQLNLGILIGVLKIIGYMSISTIFIYYSQNTILGVIAFILLASITVMLLLTTILSQDIIVKMVGDLSKHLYSILLFNEQEHFIAMGSFTFGGIAQILIYIILPTIISIVLFRKKELEF